MLPPSRAGHHQGQAASASDTVSRGIPTSRRKRHPSAFPTANIAHFSPVKTHPAKTLRSSASFSSRSQKLGACGRSAPQQRGPPGRRTGRSRQGQIARFAGRAGLKSANQQANTLQQERVHPASLHPFQHRGSRAGAAPPTNPRHLAGEVTDPGRVRWQCAPSPNQRHGPRSR